MLLGHTLLWGDDYANGGLVAISVITPRSTVTLVVNRLICFCRQDQGECLRLNADIRIFWLRSLFLNALFLLYV